MLGGRIAWIAKLPTLKAYPNLEYTATAVTMMQGGDPVEAVFSQKNSQERGLVGALLRELRLEAHLRQQDLADRLGRQQSFVSKYESGERRLDVLELREVCSVLGITLTELVECLEARLAKGANGS